MMSARRRTAGSAKMKLDTHDFRKVLWNILLQVAALGLLLLLQFVVQMYGAKMAETDTMVGGGTVGVINAVAFLLWRWLRDNQKAAMPVD